MSKKQLKKIEINKVTFFLDHRYQLVMDLISPEFEKKALIIDQLFGRDDRSAKILVDAVLQDGCANDVAMTYFIAMILQNYGEIERAGKIITRMYQVYPSDLLVRCAYANHLIFRDAFDEIPAVFNHTFDLEKVCDERELPLITFIHFISVARNYYMFKNDVPHVVKYFSYLFEAAPEHAETQDFLRELMELQGEA